MLRRDAIKDVRWTTFDQSRLAITRVPAVANKTIYHGKEDGSFHKSRKPAGRSDTRSRAWLTFMNEMLLLDIEIIMQLQRI